MWEALSQEMHRALFVVVPSGDMTGSKRFTDALLHGAIPVVFTSRYYGGKGYWQNLPPGESFHIALTAPWQPTVERSWPDIGIHVVPF